MVVLPLLYMDFEFKALLYIEDTHEINLKTKDVSPRPWNALKII